VILDPKQVLVYVVAIERYAAGPSWNLHGPVRDALDFAAWLIERGLDPTNIHAFLSPIEPLTKQDFLRGVLSLERIARHGAITAELYSALNRTLRERKPANFCLYWGGHGCIGPGRKRYLLGADATNEDPQAIDLTQFQEFLESDAVRRDAGGHTRHSVLIIDACASFLHSQGVQNTVASSSFVVGKPLTGTQFAMFATDTGERAKNLNAQNTGLFSRELREQMNTLGKLEDLFELGPIGLQLQERFAGLRERGEASQTPTYYAVRPYFDAERVQGVPGLAPVEERFPGHSVTLDELERLQAVIASLTPPLPRKRVLAAFRGARPLDEPIPRASDDYTFFCECAAVLAEQFAGPLFIFLALCRSQIEDPAIVASIATWEFTVAKRLKIDLEPWHQRAIGLQAAAAPRVLQIIVDPVFGGTGEQYRIRAALAANEEPDPANISTLGQSEAVPRERLCAQLQELLDTVLGSVDLAEISRVEAVLPRELLAGGVHHWKTQWGAEPIPLGLEYPIAIRSHERGYQKKYQGPRGKQKQKWDRLQQGLKDQQITWHACVTAEVGQLGHWRQQDTLVLGALRFSNADDKDELEGAERLICAGIPAGLWFHRPNGATETWQTLLREHIFREAIDNWPPQVLVFQQQVRSSTPFACQGLTLMWDNPHQALPPLPSSVNAPLQAPQSG
jgi:vWA-MoxR associated protein C-terminal domain/Caspase domain